MYLMLSKEKREQQLPFLDENLICMIFKYWKNKENETEIKRNSLYFQLFQLFYLVETVETLLNIGVNSNHNTLYKFLYQCLWI